MSTATRAVPVSATPERRSSGGGVASALVLRRCACGGVKGPGGGCEQCRKKVQRAPDAAGDVAGTAPPSVHRVLGSAGRPLDTDTRAFMETRFGHCFGRMAVTHSPPGIAPARLAVGPAHDRHEHEAEQAAAAVTRMDAPRGPEPGTARRGFDFSQVRVHTDGEAAESAHAVGALAYTVGRSIVFAAGRYAPGSADGRRLLAHELTHVAQQSAGEATPGLQRYTAFTAAEQAAKKSLGWEHPASATLRVSDDGQMVAEDRGWGANQSKRAWTTAAKIAASNAALAAQGSKVKLVSKGAGISGNAPAAPSTSVKLEEIEPVEAVGGGPLNLAQDCGNACKQVMGSGVKDVAVLKGPTTEKYTAARSYYADDKKTPVVENTTPEDWAEEVFKMEFGAGLTRAQVYAKYDALSPADKTKFDKKYGLNKYAVPGVGQGLTVSTEKDMPGFARVPGKRTWNFHFAATVLASGQDYVTLENAARWQPTDWIFFMYGPASKAQTFHEFHGATETHGTKWTTMVVQPEKALHRKTRAKDAPLLVGTKITKLPAGTDVKIIEKSTDGAKNEWNTVTVESGPHVGLTGKIMSVHLL